MNSIQTKVVYWIGCVLAVFAVNVAIQSFLAFGCGVDAYGQRLTALIASMALFAYFRSVRPQ